MPEYMAELPNTGGESIDITARNDKAAKKKARTMLAECGTLEYKWQDDTTYRVLCLYKFMGDDADVTHEHICDIKERVGSGNLVEVTA